MLVTVPVWIGFLFFSIRLIALIERLQNDRYQQVMAE